MGFTRAELDSFRGADVPDLVGPGCRLLFVGINPGLWTADELSREELRAGGARLVETVRRWEPRVVAVAGITAYRSAFGARTAVMGRQPDDLAGAQLWVVPNPSGLNAHETVASLATAYAAPARAAGVLP